MELCEHVGSFTTPLDGQLARSALESWGIHAPRYLYHTDCSGHSRGRVDFLKHQTHLFGAHMDVPKSTINLSMLFPLPRTPFWVELLCPNRNRILKGDCHFSRFYA